MRETEIVKEMGKRYPNAEIDVHEVEKVNGVVLRGLVIREGQCNVSPTIYLNNFEGYEVQEACDKISKVYEQNKLTKDIDISWFTDFEQVKSKIRMKLLNTERNAGYLEDKPSVNFLDLSIVFYAEVDCEAIGSGTVKITNNHIKMWDVNADELYEIAKANKEYTLTDMADFMEKHSEGNIPEEEIEAMRGCQFILSNADRVFGAGVLPAALDSLKERFGKFYLIPSSVNEWLVIPDSFGLEKEFLDNMVREVNNTTLEPEEVLSDHAYYFNGETLEV